MDQVPQQPFRPSAWLHYTSGNAFLDKYISFVEESSYLLFLFDL